MIKIILKSFFINEINSYLFFFFKNVKKKYIILGPFFMPKNITKLTLLVSPHVDKNSRDQLELKFYKIFFLIKNYDNNLLKFLNKNKNIEGIEIKYEIV